MPLHYAAWSGQLDAARVLVDRGANIGARDKNGKTALDLANIPKKSEIANFLKAKQSEYDNKLLAAMHRSKRQIYTPSVDKQISHLRHKVMH